MAYFINKTDGTAIVVLDGTKDVTSTSLTLVGRLASNYGEVQNENFVKLLENFAFTVPPAFPIVGQLWYDTAAENLKVYTPENDWQVVGSVISGNVDISGNLALGQNNFEIQEIGGNVNFINSASSGNISFYSNVSGIHTRVLHVNGNNGLAEVAGNATSALGIATKSYVDEISAQGANAANVALAANVAIINANLVARINAENDLRANIEAANIRINVNNIDLSSVNANLSLRVLEESKLRANIEAANVVIDTKDTIARVDLINSAIDSAIASNVATINANLVTRINQIVEVETQMLANVGALNATVFQILGISNGADSAANSAIGIAQTDITNLQNQVNQLTISTQANLVAGLSTKAATNSPTFTGTPTAPTASPGTSTAQIATTAFVMARSVFWDGSRKFVSTQDPTASDGADGDIWFKYS